MVDLAIEQAAARLLPDARSFFEAQPILVPVPRSGLTKPNTVWPSRRICEELIRRGLGESVADVVKRAVAVPKSAGNDARPSLQTHLSSLAVQPRFRPPSRLIVVDDVVTTGTTMMACAQLLSRAYPGVPIAGFALARVLSKGDPSQVFEPRVETISVNDGVCSRK